MPLVYFLLGIVFIELLLPILNKASEVIITWLETHEAKYGECINNANLRMKKATLELEDEKPSRMIGFTYSDDEDLIEEEDED